MRIARTQAGLAVFLLYCALLAIAGPTMYWSARLGLHVPAARVQGFVGYFWEPDGLRLSHVAIPLEGDRALFLDGAEVSGIVSAGMQVEKRRGEFAVRLDGALAEWPLRSSHLALLVGGCLALALLARLVARAPFAGTRLGSIVWLGSTGRVALLLAPGLATVLIGIIVAFARGELDQVVAASTLGAATLGAVAWNHGVWRRVRERVVLARAHRLAAADAGSLACLRGTVRRVEDDLVELTVDGGGFAQAELTTSQRLGLGRLPHAPIAVGDHLEIIGRVAHVVDPTAEQLPREPSLARRLFGADNRPLLIVATESAATIINLGAVSA
jgi:hypothetical protein